MYQKIKNKLKALRPSVDKRLEAALSMSALDVGIDIAIGNQVKGDYLEFGVYRGLSFARAYHRFQSHDKFFTHTKDTRFFAFDSFEGLPLTEDSYAPEQYSLGAYSASKLEFFSNIKRLKVDTNKVIAIKGWYSELDDKVKEEHNLNKAAVIYLDADLYESTRDALGFCASLIQDGTIVVLDDFYRHKASPYRGVQRAFNEFLLQNDHLIATQVHNFRRVAFSLNYKI
jgi:hypothetical protein